MCQSDADDWARKVPPSARHTPSPLAPPSLHADPALVSAHRESLASVSRLRARLAEINEVNASHMKRMEELDAALGALRAAVGGYEGECRALSLQLERRKAEWERRRQAGGGALGGEGLLGVVLRVVVQW